MVSKSSAGAWRSAPSGEFVRTGTQPETLVRAVADHLRYSLGRLPAVANARDYYCALALAVRDRMLDRWTRTTESKIDRAGG